jgi:hypothetical protein
MASNLLKRKPMFRKQRVFVGTLYQFGASVQGTVYQKGSSGVAVFFRDGIHVNRTVRRSLPQVGYAHANL